MHTLSEPLAGGTAVAPELIETAPKPNIDDGKPWREAKSRHFAIIELILKDSEWLHRFLRDARYQRLAIPRFVAISVIGYSIFGVALVIVFMSAQVWPVLTPLNVWLNDRSVGLIHFVREPSVPAVWARLIDGSALDVILTYTLGMIAALGICLPSYYFYGLLAGIRTSMLEVTAHAMKSIATGALALVGILPIYVAAILGLLVFEFDENVVRMVLQGGLLLPFVGGLFGLESLYRGFTGLAETMREDWRCRRECLLRRLTLACSLCYTAVTPVMIHALWIHLAG